MTFGNLERTRRRSSEETNCAPCPASFRDTRRRENSSKVRHLTRLSSFLSTRVLPIAPHPISRRLVISARPTLPTPPQSSPEASPVVHQNPPRPRHPPELLTHRFVPVGSLVDAANEDVDMDAAEPEPEASHARKSAKHEDKSKKKRKVDAESPKKKTKKAKTAS